MAILRNGLRSPSSESKNPPDPADEVLVDHQIHLPSQCKFQDQFTEKNEIKSERKLTFHQIRIWEEELPDSIRKFYLKENTPGSSISEIEAAIASFYRLLAPDYIADTYAVYSKKLKNYIGVASEEFPNFKSTAEHPITEDDFDTRFLEEKNLSIELIDKLANKLMVLNKAQALTRNKARKVEQLEVQHKVAFKSLEINPQSLSREEREALRVESKNNLDNKNTINNQFLDQISEMESFYAEILKKYNLTKRELEKYCIVKGTAIALTTSYIFDEDDLHRYNWSKLGQRLDFDMSLWRLCYHYKEEILARSRKPTEDTFKVTAGDIRNFPNLVNAQPSYWPTRPLTLMQDTFLLVWKQFVETSANPYPQPITLLYQKINKNPIFVYHFYSILGKFVISNPNIFKQLAKEHIREDTPYGSTLLYGHMAELQEEKIAEFRRVLITMPEFAEFFKKHQRRLADELSRELKDNLESEIINVESAALHLLKLMDISRPSIWSGNMPLSFLFGKKKTIEVKTIHALSAEELEKVKSQLEDFATRYINPAFFKAPTHKLLITNLLNYSQQRKPDIDNCKKNVMELKLLEKQVQTILTKKIVNDGTARSNLLSVLQSIKQSLAVLPQEVSLELQTPRLSKTSPCSPS